VCTTGHRASLSLISFSFASIFLSDRVSNFFKLFRELSCRPGPVAGHIPVAGLGVDFQREA
jgi:hypothetical protein